MSWHNCPSCIKATGTQHTKEVIKYATHMPSSAITTPSTPVKMDKLPYNCLMILLFLFQSLKHVQLLQPHEPYPAWLLCPWAFPGKNTGVGWDFLLQGVFPTQGNARLLHKQVDSWPLSHYGSLFNGTLLVKRLHLLLNTTQVLKCSMLSERMFTWASLVAQLVKNPPECRRPGSNPWGGKIPWTREWLLSPVFWPEEFHGLCSSWGHKSQTQLSNFLFFKWKKPDSRATYIYST